MPQVRIDDENYQHFQKKAEREDRTVQAQINRDLRRVAEDEIEAED